MSEPYRIILTIGEARANELISALVVETFGDEYADVDIELLIYHGTDGFIQLTKQGQRLADALLDVLHQSAEDRPTIDDVMTYADDIRKEVRDELDDNISFQSIKKIYMTSLPGTFVLEIQE